MLLTYDLFIFRESYKSNLTSNNVKMSLKLLSSPSRLIGFIAVHTFGISLIYPGSTSLLFYLSKIFYKNYIKELSI